MARKTSKELLQDMDDRLEQLKNGIYIEPEYKSLIAKKMAYYYSFIRFNGMETDEALKTVKENSYEQLAKISKVNVEKKIEDAASCVRKHLFKAFEYGVDGSFEEAVNGFHKDGRPVEKDLENNFMKALGSGIDSYFEGNIYDALLDIAEELHNKWVLENATDLETEPTDENLFRHLPFELAGFDEISESLLYVLPIMDRFGIPYVGYGPSDYKNKLTLDCNLRDRYIQRVNKLQEKCGMKSAEDLKNQLPKLIKEYESLNSKNAPKGQKELFEKRLEYMLSPEKLEILKEEVEDQNTVNYGEKFLFNEWGI